MENVKDITNKKLCILLFSVKKDFKKILYLGPKFPPETPSNDFFCSCEIDGINRMSLLFLHRMYCISDTLLKDWLHHLQGKRSICHPTGLMLKINFLIICSCWLWYDVCKKIQGITLVSIS